MRWFRVAAAAPPWRHLVATLLQVAVFWSTFLVVLPWALVQVELRLGLPPAGLPLHREVGTALFALASALGLGSGVFMALRGRGTPLPLCSARDLVVHGVYRVLRNPMALAGIAQGYAVGVFLDSALVTAYALAGGLVWHFAVRPAEERDLLARFGAAFADYRDRVPLWLPALAPRTGSPRLERLVGLALAAVPLGALLAAWLAGPTPSPDVLAAAPAAAGPALLGLVLATRPRAAIRG